MVKDQLDKMRVTLFTFAALLLWSHGSWAQGPRYHFIPNAGQWHEEVLSRADVEGGHLYLSHEGMVIHLWDREKLHRLHHSQTGVVDPQHLDAHVIRMRFATETSPAKRLINIAPFSTRYSFFLDKNPSRWAAGIFAYHEQVIENLFEGIDWRFYQEADMKYDFIVKPKADVGKLKFTYDGADSVFLEHGHLRIKTILGDIIEGRPQAYQVLGGEKVAVSVAFELSRDSIGRTWISYDFPEGYDPSEELTIDPLLIFSTLSGSFSDNWGNTATFDESGALYSGGTVFAPNFPVTAGAYQITFANGATDVGLMKYDSTGRNLLSATFLGGNGTEIPHSLLIDNAGDLLILGTTGSSSLTFPTTVGAFDETFNGGEFDNFSVQTFTRGVDMFVTKLDSTLTTLEASTFIGGNGTDGLNTINTDVLNRNYGDEVRGDIAVDSMNHVYITGITTSGNFPTTVGALDRTLSGDQDGVVCKFTPGLDTLVWSTFIGGNGIEGSYSLKLDPFGNAVVAGGTNSTDFPTTAGAINTTYQGGSTDGFVAVISPDGDSLVAGTFLGTGAYDQVYIVDVDYNDTTFAVIGQSQGAYPFTNGVYRNPNSRQFIHKLSANLDATIFSTTIGASGSVDPDFTPTAFLVNTCSNIFVAGWGGVDASFYSQYLNGTTDNLSTTSTAVQRTTDGHDFYFTVLSGDGSERLFATFYGADESGTNPIIVGDHVDGGTSRFDKQGIIYQAVCSCSGGTSFPTTPTDVYSSVNNSNNCNNGAIKYDLSTIIAGIRTSSTDSLISGRAGCDPYPVLFENLSNGGQEYQWDLGDGTLLTRFDLNPFEHTYQEPGDYVVSMTAIDRSTCASQEVIYDSVTVFPTGFVSDSAVFCRGARDTLTAMTEAPSATFRWSPNIAIDQIIDDGNSQRLVVSPDSSVRYQVIITTASGCRDTLQSLARVVQPITADFTSETATSCDTVLAVSFTNLSTNAQTYQWFFSDGQTSQEENPLIQFPDEGTYSATLIASDGPCFNDTIKTVFAPVDNGFLDFLQNIGVSRDRTICIGDTAQIFAFGANAYTWSPAESLSRSNIENPLAFPDLSTRYTVSLLYKDSCLIDSAVSVDVVPRVEASFAWSTSSECGLPSPVIFTNGSIEASSYTISFGDGQQITTSEFPSEYSYDSSGTYLMTVTASNGVCIDQTVEQINYEFVNPPNVFTPNGDGKNETLDIGAASENWGLTVYNRWGNEIYRSPSYQNDWTGDGLPNGSYYYLLESVSGSSCKGWILILR